MDAAYRSIPDFTRGFDFEMRSAGGGDGRTLEGYVAMFDARSRIPDRNGDFDEILRPGFADRSLKERGMPIMQFDHGKDPRVGTVPIGVYEVFDRDNKGYAVRGRLFDNPVVEPVRQAIEGRAIKGMSFRFTVKGRTNGDRWHRRGQGLARTGDVEVREILDADVHEAGPVVFPAYAQTSVSVRAAMATWRDEDIRALLDELQALTGRAVDLTDLTGAPTRGVGRGEPDAQPREGDAPTPAQLARIRALQTLRDPIVLP